MSQRGSQKAVQVVQTNQPAKEKELIHPVVTYGTKDKFKPYVGRQPIQRVEHVFGGLDPKDQEYSNANYSKWKTKQLTTNERNEGNFRFHVSGKVSTVKKNINQLPPKPKVNPSNKRIHSAITNKIMNRESLMRKKQAVESPNLTKQVKRIRTKGGIIVEENMRDIPNRQGSSRGVAGSSKKTNAYGKLVGQIKKATRNKLKK